MKFATTLLLAAGVGAFPTMIIEEALRRDPDAVAKALELYERENSDLVAKSVEFVKRGDYKRQAGTASAELVFEPAPYFDEKSQFINVAQGSGHEWRAPGKNDQRGPCPGLNAFANHGFLPRNGVGTIAQFIQVTNEVVGMSLDLGGFLAVLGAAIDGDGTQWSIGGPPGANRGNGLIGSHNKYESDVSPTRPDLYQYGNNYENRIPQYNAMIAANPGSVTIENLTKFRAQRFQESLTQNPYFFNGPFTGVLVQPAAYTFIYRFMANHSTEAPRGYLSHEVIASWFGVEKNGNNGYKLVNGKQFQERIPENWYRRAQAYPYSIPYFNAEVIAAGAAHPEFFNVGGNTNGPNTFAGVDVSNLTGGVFNSATLLEGNNLACYVYQLSAQAQPDVALAAPTQLFTTLGQISSKLGCPQLQKIDQKQLSKFPGYQKAPAYGK